MHDLTKLNIWHKAMELSTIVYELTAKFPREEKYGLTSQIRRSAVSVPSNIAEGAGRNSTKEFIYFLSVSNGSSYELQTQLILSKKLKLINDDVNQVLDQINQIQKKNYSLQKKLTS